MKTGLSLIAVVVLACLSTTALANDRAATGELPAALQALGVDQAAVVSNADAHSVRGEGLIQTKSFSVTGGTAVGTTNLLEGVFGTFSYTKIGDDMSTLVVEGTFGGLEGTIGVSDGNLSFQFGGKALQETFDFVGKFEQSFFQEYTP